MWHTELSSLGDCLPDKPRLEESDCPGNQTWVKGTEQMLACVPKGNPTPALVCTWNGVIFHVEVPHKAAYNHTGTYCCTATNQLGSVSKDIAVIVQGDCGSPCCQAQDGNPPGVWDSYPNLERRKLPVGGGRVKLRGGCGRLGEAGTLSAL